MADNSNSPSITVLGGARLTKIDEDELRRASAAMAAAADRLAQARSLVANAAANLDTAARWAVNNSNAGRAAFLASPTARDPIAARAQALREQNAAASASAASRAAADARASLPALTTTSDECRNVSTKLLKAGNLYAEQEHSAVNTIEVSRQLLTYGVSFGAGLLGSIILPLFASRAVAKMSNGYQLTSDGHLVSPYQPKGLQSAASNSTPSKSGFFSHLAMSPLAQFLQRQFTELSIADDAILGLSLGLTAFHSLSLFRGNSVPEAARTLSVWSTAKLPPMTVCATQYYPGLTPSNGISVPKPAWTGTPARTVAEGIYRSGQFESFGSPVPGRNALGMPEGTLQIDQWENPDGTRGAVAYIPGTQGFKPGTHPFDGITDLDLMAGGPTGIEKGLDAALAQAGVSPGDSVVLFGHSLAGILATKAAADPGFNQKYQVSGIVTAGSPVATFDVPPEIPVLHFENSSDLVPKTDGKDSKENRISENEVTVVGTFRPGSPQSATIIEAHKPEAYVAVAEAAKDSGNIAYATANKQIEDAMRPMEGAVVTTTFVRLSQLPEVIVPSCRTDEEED